MEPSMTDLVELSHLDPARDRRPDSFDVLRSQVALDRIIDGSAGRPGRGRPPLRRVAIGVAVVALAITGAVVVPALLPDAADKAFASWTATPTPVDPRKVLPEARNCVESYGDDPAAVTAADVVLAEQRGTATSLIVKHGQNALECMSVEAGKTYASQQLPGEPLIPRNGLLSVDTSSSIGSGDTEYSHVVGFLTPKVTGIDLILPNGRTVHTSAAAGWWTAWWPGPEGGEADTVRVVAHTATGAAEYRIAQLDD